MQTVHHQTLLLREAYLDGFSVHDLPVINQQKIRSSSLFSSQVLPTQAVFSAKEEFERRTGKDIHKNLDRALHAASRPVASTSASSSYQPGSAKRKKKRRRHRSQLGGRNSGHQQQPQQQQY